jgi:hypothetical protein
MRCKLDEDIAALRNEIFDLKEARWRLERRVADLKEAERRRRRRERERKLSPEQLRAEGKMRAAAGGYYFEKYWTGCKG